MRYNPVSDDVSVTPERPVDPTLPSTNQNIYRLRRKAFIFITIEMIIISLLIGIEILRWKENLFFDNYRYAFKVFLSLIVFLSASVAVYRYYRTGITVLFWYMIIENIIDGATMTRILILLIKRASRVNDDTEFIIFMTILILILLGKLVLDIFTLITLHRLARSIKLFKQNLGQQL